MLPLLALLIQAAACEPSTLYCFELVPVPGLRVAGGTVELRRVPSPFGVAVTRDGHHLYDLVVTLRGLPEPGALVASPQATYVAWLTT
ncbi:MAG TPA: hypothetical protein VNI61_06060, partial [Gemmatimonadales bacterium]|nr:hypothetical protein [Gemmatimonadales bacterium]